MASTDRKGRGIRRVALGLGGGALVASLLFAVQGGFGQSVGEALFDDDPAAAEQRAAERAARRDQQFHQHLESARSLLGAYDRAVEEGSLGETAAATSRSIREGLERAEAQFAAGEKDRAREVLQKAYLRVKMSLQAALDGKTRHLALDFESPEEEYRYEQRRYDTHRLLVSRFLAEPELDEASRGRVNEALEEGDARRSQAQDEADQGDHATAIASLEAATRELIRALRSVGIFIPG